MTTDPLLVAAATFFGVLAGDEYEPPMAEMPGPSWLTMPSLPAEVLVPPVDVPSSDPTPSGGV